MANYIADYSNYLEIERRASDNTVASYVRDVTQFSRYLSEEEGTDLAHVEQEQVENYLHYMTNKGKSLSSVARALASLKSFYHYMVRVGAVKEEPTKNTAPIRSERKLPQILTGEEVELFLEQPQCVDAKGFRDRAMLELLYATGIRVSELINLDVSDLNYSAVSGGGEGADGLCPGRPAPAGAQSPGDVAVCEYERGAYEPSRVLEDRQALSGDGADR